jgi:ankyrin repeat protein
MKLAVLLSILILPFAIAAEPRQLLQEGLFEEEANRDLDKASAAYESLIAAFDKERQYAATALFRLAEIRAKQNRKEEAVALFQRVITDFSTNEPLARLSRERIAALGGNVPALPGGGPATSDQESQEIARLQDLIKNSPDLLNPGKDGASPLGNAAQQGWLKAATLLLDHGANPNGPPGGTPPIQQATFEGRKAMVELLIARGADVNARSIHYLTPLQTAAEHSRLEVARVLLQHGAKIDATGVEPGQGRTALHIACAKGDISMARLFLEWKADPNVVSCPPGPLDPDRAPGTPLMEAVRSQNVELVTFLLDRGANPNVPVNEGKDSALRTAVLSGPTAITKLLLDRGADPNSSSVVFVAVSRNSPELVELLASKKANLDAKIPNTRGQTSLHRTADNLEMTKLLLKLGASPKVADDDGTTPLHLAVRVSSNSNQSARSRTAVIPRPGPPPAPSPSRPTLPIPGPPQPIRFVSPPDAPRPAQADGAQPQTGVELCRLLLKHGADINARDAINNTPFHTAAMYMASDEVFEWLLANSADPAVTNTEGKTPLDIADLPRRIWLEQRIRYPKLAKQHAIHAIRAFYGGPSATHRVDSVTEFDSPPNLREVVKEALKGIDDPHQGSYPALVFRADRDGKIVEVARLSRDAVSLSSDSPHLEWGDIVVVCDHSLVSHQSNAAFPVPYQDSPTETVPKPRNITIRVGDRETSIGLVGSQAGFAWSPTMGQIPEWRFSELMVKIASGEPHTLLGAVKVQRTINGEVKEWTVDIRPEKPGQLVKNLPARLADGDKVIVPLAGFDDPEALKARKAGIFRTAPTGIFGERIFQFHEKDDAPRTLGELIAESDRVSMMVVPEPDFSAIRIRRLKPDGSGEITLTVDLTKAIESISAKTPQKDARALDVPLEWGDIVEIKAIKGAKLAEWTGLTPQVKLFLTKALSREVHHRINDQEFKAGLFAPTPRNFGIDPNNYNLWKFSPPPKSDFRPMRFPSIIGSNQVKIRLISRGKTHEYSPDEFRAINPWLLDQDKIEVETF